jgi:glycosyltransferase involved in cell wall biosynthesis
MKILIYSESFFPAIGGLERIAFELARGLAQHGTEDSASGAFDVTVATRTPGNTVQDEDLPFRIVRRPSLRQLSALIRQTDVVHLAGPVMLPMALGLIMRKTMVIEHHGFQTICPNGQLFYAPERSPCVGHYMAGEYMKCFRCNLADAGALRSAKMLLLTPMRRWLANRARINITPTAWLASLLKLHRMQTVHHGISLSADKKIAAISPSVFAFQGRLVSTKGAEVLLKAAKQLRAERLEFVIKIIGDGPERRALEAQAALLDGSVQFLGHVSDERLPDIFSEVSAVVMPSLGGEVFGLVAAENMLRGKVLIVSNLGSLEEVVGNTGMIARAGSAEELAACMRRVIEEPSLVHALGLQAQERATRLFNVRKMIQSHVSIYQEASQ